MSLSRRCFRPHRHASQKSRPAPTCQSEPGQRSRLPFPRGTGGGSRCKEIWELGFGNWDLNEWYSFSVLCPQALNSKSEFPNPKCGYQSIYTNSFRFITNLHSPASARCCGPSSTMGVDLSTLNSSLV